MTRTKANGKGPSLLRVVREFAPYAGGAITHVLELSQAIDPYLDQQVIFAPHAPGCETFDTQFPIEIIRARSSIFYTKFPMFDDLVYSRKVAETLKEIILAREIEIVHFHAPILAAYTIPYLRAWNPALRFVVMAHGWPERRERRFGVSSVLGRKLIGGVPPDHFILLEDGSQFSELQEVLDQRAVPTSLVYHAIDTAIYRPLGIEDPSTFSILFPHRPADIKRPEIALEIFREFRSRVGDPSVTIVFTAVKPSYHETTFRSVESGKDGIMLFGALDQETMVHQMNRSSVVIGTSLNSNKGRAIQEAMACGRPVVAFDRGNMSELISDGKTGLLVEPGNIDAFVDALERLYRSPGLRTAMGINAREAIVQKRSWETRIETELAIYRRLIDRN